MYVEVCVLGYDTALLGTWFLAFGDMAVISKKKEHLSCSVLNASAQAGEDLGVKLYFHIC
jgi:hypothetical protein